MAAALTSKIRNIVAIFLPLIKASEQQRESETATQIATETKDFEDS